MIVYNDRTNKTIRELRKLR